MEAHRHLLALLSDPGLVGVSQLLLEKQAELELGSLLSATEDRAQAIALARLNLVLHLLDLPQRVATFNSEYRDDRAKRDAAVQSQPRAASFHLGSPHFWGTAGAFDTDSAR